MTLPLLAPSLIAAFSALVPLAVRGDEPDVRSVIFVLSDDHRYDFMGFHPAPPEWLETPANDCVRFPIIRGDPRCFVFALHF